MDVGKLPILQLMKHSFDYTGQRQKVLAQNLANVDTPGYKSTDMTPFREENFSRMLSKKLSMDTRTAGHIQSSRPVGTFKESRDDDPWEISRSGNTVVLEDQISRMNDNRGQHRLTTEIYKKQLGMLRTTLQMTQR